MGATRAILWRAWPPPMRGCSFLSASTRRRRLSSRTSFSRPICVPDSPVKPDRVRVTSSTGVLGRSVSSLLSDYRGGFLPRAGRLLEPDDLLPGRPAGRRTEQLRGPCVPAFHVRPGICPPEEGVDRHEQGLHGGGVERQRGVLDHRLLERHGDDGTVVDAIAELPGARSLGPEPVREHVPVHCGDCAHRVQAETVHLAPHVHGDGKQVDGMGREEGLHVFRDPEGPMSRGRPCGDERGELRARNADAGSQVCGDRVQQGRYGPGLAPVHPFEAVDAHVCSAEFGLLDAVADPLQRCEHPAEHPPVMRPVGVQHDSVRMAGQGLLQGHPSRHPRGGPKAVDDHGPRPGGVPVDDQDGAVLQVRMSGHLHLGSQVSDEYAGDPHKPPVRGISGQEIIPNVRSVCQSARTC